MSISARLTLGLLIVLATPATVLAAAPTITTNPATNVTDTGATLSAAVNSGLETTFAWFRYSTTHPGTCDDSFGTKVPVSGTSVAASSNTVTVSFALGGLGRGTTYFYCALASNASGLVVGTIESFTTIPAPFVGIAPTTSITNDSAVLNASVNPTGLDTVVWFRYSTTHPGTCNDSWGTRAPSTGGTNIPAGLQIVPTSLQVSGLTPRSYYYVCAFAENAAGVSVSSTGSFYVVDLPSVSTSPINFAQYSPPQLWGTVNAHGSPTEAWFRYDTVNPGSCNDSFGTRVPQGANPVGSSTLQTSFSEEITGVAPDTTYYFCALASNSVGLTTGTVLSFTTPSLPVVQTDVAVVDSTSATLQGQANTNGLKGSGWFRFSTSPGTCSDTFGTREPVTGSYTWWQSSILQPFTRPVSGLTPNTTYYYCAVAESSVGRVHGQVLSFTTLAPPSVVTSAPTAVTQATAQLNGAANPNGSATTVWFRFSTTNPGACNDTFGTRSPATGGTSIGDGRSPVPVFETVPTPAQNTFHYVCAIAQNAEGLSFGAVIKFTSSSKPSATTAAATSVTQSGAVLNGSANPWREPAEGWFRYHWTNPGTCNDTFGIRLPATGGIALGAGDQPVPFSQPLPSVVPGSTYYYCAIAANPTGTAFGTVQSVSIPAPPTIVSSFAVAITGTSAELHGGGNPNNSTTTTWFRIGTTDPGTCNDTFGSRQPTAGGHNLGSGSTTAIYQRVVTGLLPATTYYWCAVGSNALGFGFGDVKSFTTLSPPTVTTNLATNITASTAALNGQADPEDQLSSGWFRYSATPFSTCSDTVGTRVPATGGTSLGFNNPTPYSQTVSGLQSGTTYYFCALASNGTGTSGGQVRTFTTLPTVPVVTTTGVGTASGLSVPMQGTVNPDGVAATAWFRYGGTHPGTCTQSFGIRAPASGGVAIPAGKSATPFQVLTTTISPGQTYYFCAVAANSAGTTHGPVMSFTAPAKPGVTTTPATSVAATTAVLQATVDPNRTATTAWFRYDVTPPGATCNDSFGVRSPASGGIPVGSGDAQTGVSQSIAGLTSGATYYACAFAQNAAGTTFGATVQSFTTPRKPGVTTSSASEVTSEGAVLNGTASPGGRPTTGWFRIDSTPRTNCSDQLGTRVPASGGVELGGGFDAQGFALPIVGLVPGVQYYFCALASNDLGVEMGELLTFTVEVDPPVVTTDEVTDLESRTVVLRGSANPNRTDSGGWFRYGTAALETCDDSFGTRVPDGENLPLGLGNEPVEYSIALTKLLPNTTYRWCAIASNLGGASFGELRSFKTPTEPPVVTTLVATKAEDGQVTLKGSVKPNGSAGAGWFQVSREDPGTCSSSNGERVPLIAFPIGAVHEEVPLVHAFESAEPGTYYYCAAAQTEVSAVFGAVRSFEVAAEPDAVSTGCGASAAGSSGLSALLLVALMGLFRRRTRS